MADEKKPPLAMMLSFVLLLLATLILPAHAQTAPDEAGSPKLLWSLPSIRMLDVIRSSDGTIFILTQDDKKENSLLVGANESGPGRPVPLANSKALPGSDARLVEGEGNTLWIGGTRNTRSATFGGLLSDGYLAKIDREGHLSWELEFARSNRKIELQSIASLPSGDVVVAGKEDDHSWLARVSKDGRLSWEKTFGLGAIASVAVTGDVILAATFDTSAERITGPIQARVILWRFSDAGQLLGQQTIRDEITQIPSALWVMNVTVAANAVFVFSTWTEPWTPRSAKPLNIVKMDAQGRVLWQKEIADTLRPSRVGPRPCVQAVIVLTDGSALADCLAEGGIKLFRLEPNAGEVTEKLLPNRQRPNCEGISGVSWFIVQPSEKDVWLFGTGGGCTWLQQMSLSDFRK